MSTFFFCVSYPHNSEALSRFCLVLWLSSSLHLQRIGAFVAPCEHSRVDARRVAGVGAVLGQRRRQWVNIVPTLAGRFWCGVGPAS